MSQGLLRGVQFTPPPDHRVHGQGREPAAATALRHGDLTRLWIEPLAKARLAFDGARHGWEHKGNRWHV